MSVWYLATPYTNYPDGHEAAAELAAQAAADCFVAGVSVFSPIAHTHAIEQFAKLGPNHEPWIELNSWAMWAAVGLIVVTAPGWRESRGIKHEMEFFLELKKPTVMTLPETILRDIRLLTQTVLRAEYVR